MIGKMASGICDDLLSTILGAVNCPVVMAPAMDSEMYENPVVRRNIASLRQIGVDFIGPQSGSLASGATGIGRMSEPEEILSFAVDKLTVHNDMEGKVILVTAGPTRELIDPVRYISNMSSGKMGYAIAGAAKKRGGKVIMISGPTALTPPSGIDCIHVTTVEEMYTSVMNRLAEVDVVIMSAAGSDFRPVKKSDTKIKKGESLTLNLVKATDILSEIQKKKGRQFIVGFAAETEDLLENARVKLKSKHLDLIVANDISLPEAGFDKDTNKVSIIDRWGGMTEYPVMPKSEVADRILDHVLKRIGPGNG
jgi:phosphopantothenoylcysteine decarboxylase/phosphopantothenate--cysteine ligase